MIFPQHFELTMIVKAWKNSGLLFTFQKAGPDMSM